NADWPAFVDALIAQRRATWLTVGTHRLCVAAERLPLLQLIHPQASLAPTIEAPEEFRARATTREAALLETVRSRLSGAGPVTANALAAEIGVVPAQVDTALAALASEGVAMSGSFTPGAAETQWCDRGLLARIHRYTVKRLREEIEPVTTQDFMRFLFRWQHLVPA